MVDDSPAAPPPILSGALVAAIVRGMRLSATGPSGLRADHLLLAYQTAYSEHLNTVFRAVVTGRAPRYLADARLLALPKKDGGSVQLPSGRRCVGLLRQHCSVRRWDNYRRCRANSSFAVTAE